MAEAQPTISAPAPQSPLVYAIRAADGPHVKIGTTVDLNSRLPTLQSGCPLLLQVEQVASGGYETEKLLHRFLSTHRTQGEWFLCDSTIIESLFTMLREHADFLEHLKMLDGLPPAKRKRLEDVIAESGETLIGAGLAMRLPEYMDKASRVPAALSSPIDVPPGKSIVLGIRWTHEQILFVDEAREDQCFSDFVRMAALDEASRVLNRPMPSTRGRGRPKKS